MIISPQWSWWWRSIPSDNPWSWQNVHVNASYGIGVPRENGRPQQRWLVGLWPRLPHWGHRLFQQSMLGSSSHLADMRALSGASREYETVYRGQGWGILTSENGSNISIYRKTSNIIRTLPGNKFVGHSDVVGASPVRAAPTTSSFST